jgi:hypothetical protein
MEIAGKKGRKKGKPLERVGRKASGSAGAGQRGCPALKMIAKPILSEKDGLYAYEVCEEAG